MLSISIFDGCLDVLRGTLASLAARIMMETNFLFMDSISDSRPSSFFQSIRLKTEISLVLLALEKSNLVMVERDERLGLN